MKPIQLTFSGESLAEVYALMSKALEQHAPAVVAYVDEKIKEAPKAVVPPTKPEGSHPKTYEAMKSAVSAIIGSDKEKLSRHKEILANFEVSKISDIDLSDYPLYWAEVQKL